MGSPFTKRKRRTNLREVWNFIFYILTRGSRWIDLLQNEGYAHRTTAYRWLSRWQKVGMFDRVKGKRLVMG